MDAQLRCHPETPTNAVRGIAVRVRRSPDGLLALRYELDGDLSRIRVPAPTQPQLTHKLWEHTCFETFIAAEETPAYAELNLSPSGEWAGYLFGSYREIAGLATINPAPSIAARASGDRLTLDASVHLDQLSAAYIGAVLRLGLSAVIESSDGSLSYWALCHPPGKPDFHHADARTLRLERSTDGW